MTERPFARLALAAALVLLTTPVGCRRNVVPAAATPRPVENPTLGLEITDLPAPFQVVDNSPAGLTLSAGPDALVELHVDGRESGVDVVAEAKRAQKEFEAFPGGSFAGGNEMMTPSGSAYTVRGTYQSDGKRVEERRTFLVHPESDKRLVTIVYRYPPGDAAAVRERLQQTLDLVSALESEPAPAASPAST
jgi:hypothetical protein